VLGQLPDFGFAVCGVDDDAPDGLAEGKAAYFSAVDLVRYSPTKFPNGAACEGNGGGKTSNAA
jgi:hypothetical protein